MTTPAALTIRHLLEKQKNEAISLSNYILFTRLPLDNSRQPRIEQIAKLPQITANSQQIAGPLFNLFANTDINPRRLAFK